MSGTTSMTTHGGLVNAAYSDPYKNANNDVVHHWHESGTSSQQNTGSASSVNTGETHIRENPAKLRTEANGAGAVSSISDRVGVNNADQKQYSHRQKVQSRRGDVLQNGRGKGEVADKSRCKEPKIFKTISNGIIHGMERAFYKLGFCVAHHPKLTIAISVAIPLLLAIGMIRLKINNDVGEIFLQPSSRYHKEKDWVRDNLPYESRYVRYIVEGDNVLSAAAVNAIFDLYLKSLEIRVEGNQGYNDICSGVKGNCVTNSLLDLWRYNETDIRNLSTADVILAVNNVTINPTYLTEFDARAVLGGITRDKTGNIIGARATSVLWNLKSTAENADHVKDFEDAMVELSSQGHTDLQNVYAFQKDSFTEALFDGVYKDIVLLLFGFPVLFIYLTLAFGKPNLVENSVWLVTAALSGVLLSGATCYGIAIAAELMFGASHQALMFLLLAIGVDDTLVIMESWKHVDRAHPNENIEVKIGLTMKHAGVSVTVTSVSDLVAIFAGMTTDYPLMKSFCVYAALGIIALFILQNTLFPACLALDRKRIAASRDGLVPCYTHKKWTPSKFSNIQIVEPFFEKIFNPVVLHWGGKVFVLLTTATLIGVMTWSVSNLDKAYDLTIALDPDSYASKFIHAQERYFPDEGIPFGIYCGRMAMPENALRLEKMIDEYKASSAIVEGRVTSWLEYFKLWLSTANNAGQNFTLNADGYPTNSSEFHRLLTIFTNTSGVMFKDLVIFQDGSTDIQVSVMLSNLKYQSADYTSNEKALETARRIADEAGTDGKCFPFADEFMYIEIVKTVDTEMLRNFAIAGCGILLVTLILIANIRTSFLVFICVVSTTVCLGGSLHFTGIKLDGNLVIMITFSVGLAVDYSAHIGFLFMTVKGTRNERAHKALCKMGPAVWHGCFSTFLGVLVLAWAKTYSLYLFFLTFSIVVGFGLFHGLFFLPVMLSLIGPDPYDEAELDEVGVIPPPDWQGELNQAYSQEEQYKASSHA